MNIFVTFCVAFDNVCHFCVTFCDTFVSFLKLFQTNISIYQHKKEAIYGFLFLCLYNIRKETACLADLRHHLIFGRSKVMLAHGNNIRPSRHFLYVDVRDSKIMAARSEIGSKVVKAMIIAAIKLYGDGTLDQKHIKANILKSAYGRNSFSLFIERAIKSDSVIYWNKKRAKSCQ